MRVQSTAIPAVLLIEPRVFRDPRGEFLETWNRRALAVAGIEAEFVQDNMSASRQWTLRGIHYQIRQAQGKLVRVVSGEAYDVAVDLRRSSPTFGKHVAVRLSAEKHLALWIPPGFAHGLLTLAGDTRVLYKTTDYYSPEAERTLAWNDPALGIEWPLPAAMEPLMSDKDRQGATLATAETYP